MGLLFECSLYCECLAHICIPHAFMRYGKYMPIVILSAYAKFPHST
jgi:hypothetical protein